MCLGLSAIFDAKTHYRTPFMCLCFREMFDASSSLQVAEYVHSKTKEQCVMQFLRLPIEDRYLEEAQAPAASQQGNLGAGSSAPEMTATSASSVMAQVCSLRPL